MNYKEKLAVGFAIARKKAPYFDAALTGMVRVEVENLAASTGIAGIAPTMGVTDHGVLMYERGALEAWDVDEIAAVLIHEVGHLLRAHGKRRQAFGGHPVPWNMAGDAEINDDIAAGGWKLPGNCIYPKTFGARDGLTAEEYYHDAAKRVVFVCCGSGSGNPFPNEPDHPGRTDGEIANMRHRVAEAIEREKSRGTVPGGWVVWAKEQLAPPKLRWQEKLARATRRAIAARPGGVTHTWARLSRRQAACGYGPGRPLIPALSQPTPDVAVVIDTSGSMGATELKMGLAEVAGVLRAVGSSVDFIAIDAAVHSFQKVRNVDDIVPLLKGGGGTDFRPAFAKLEESRRRPEVVIFVTDGCGPAPETPPKWCRTIWLLVGQYAKAPCAWGEHVVLE